MAGIIDENQIDSPDNPDAGIQGAGAGVVSSLLQVQPQPLHILTYGGATEWVFNGKAGLLSWTITHRDRALVAIPANTSQIALYDATGLLLTVLTPWVNTNVPAPVVVVSATYIPTTPLFRAVLNIDIGADSPVDEQVIAVKGIVQATYADPPVSMLHLTRKWLEDTDVTIATWSDTEILSTLSLITQADGSQNPIYAASLLFQGAANLAAKIANITRRGIMGDNYYSVYKAIKERAGALLAQALSNQIPEVTPTFLDWSRVNPPQTAISVLNTTTPATVLDIWSDL